MDIVDLLVRDHLKIKDELEDMKRSLHEPGMRGRLERLMAHYQAHENIEEEILFPALRPVLYAPPGPKWLAGYEEQHQELWKAIQDLAATAPSLDLQEAFIHFSLLMSTHLDNEEQNLFIFAKQNLDPSILESLSREAEGTDPSPVRFPAGRPHAGARGKRPKAHKVRKRRMIA